MVNRIRLVSQVFVSFLWVNIVYAQSGAVVIPLFEDLKIVRAATATEGIDPAPGLQKTAKSSCPEGTTLIGGGASESGTLVIADSSATISLWGTAWSRHPGAHVPTDVVVYAICVEGCLNIQHMHCGNS